MKSFEILYNSFHNKCGISANFGNNNGGYLKSQLEQTTFIATAFFKLSISISDISSLPPQFGQFSLKSLSFISVVRKPPFIIFIYC
ncbi:MAG: hypothetical protein ACTSRP_09640 [Candidatus Helarchaeota archaeon]